MTRDEIIPFKYAVGESRGNWGIDLETWVSVFIYVEVMFNIYVQMTVQEIDYRFHCKVSLIALGAHFTEKCFFVM